MGKKKIILIIVCILIFILFFTGFPISRKINHDECEAEYVEYLLPRTLCQMITDGHCMTTGISMYNAEMKISQCLCDKYLSENNSELGEKILARCEGLHPSCEEIVYHVANESCNDIRNESESDSCFENAEKIKEQYRENIPFICKNKQRIFHKIYID